jgi:hypothetical protein
VIIKSGHGECRCEVSDCGLQLFALGFHSSVVLQLVVEVLQLARPHLDFVRNLDGLDLVLIKLFIRH